ncbi:MAG TPA: hypothetical protein VKU36_01780 [Candidatus Babeliales bacterium]|nr:hypothetical protein [Candidatus Babeliales bacterium]
MNVGKVFLSGVLIASSFVSATSNYGVYYNELKALQENPTTKGLFEQDLDGGSCSTQCNLEDYRPLLMDMSGHGLFSLLIDMRKALSLGTFQRRIMEGKKLSFISCLLQTGLSGPSNADLIIVTSDTMPALYNYIDSLAKKSAVKTPVVFISLKKGFFKSFSRKICMFTGSMVIGQQMLEDLSDEAIEAAVARNIASIKYNHSNKKFVLNIAMGAALSGITVQLFLSQNDVNKWISLFTAYLTYSWFAVPALSSLIVGKRFARHVDAFACKEADRAKGLIELYECLQERDQTRAAGFDKISNMLGENAADISLLVYFGLLVHYYMAKAEHCVVGTYNKFAYPSYEQRIEETKKYLQQA